MQYFGGKNHLYQAIINCIPRHTRFVEAFAGSAAVARHLARGDAEGLVIERDFAQAARLKRLVPGHRVLCDDALDYLERHGADWGPETVIFADPPYPLEDRRDPRPRYMYEFCSAQHEHLAELLHASRARVLVCGHPWGRYPALYRTWKRHEFSTVLRSGRPGVECLWTNYDDPYPLHDYRYWGDDKRVRQDLRRQVERNVEKFDQMDRHARVAVLRAIVAKFGAP